MIAVKIETQIDSLGHCLAVRRKEKRLSIDEVSQQLSIPRPTLYRIEKGSSISAKWLVPIAAWCGLDPFDLWKLLAVETQRSGYTLPLQFPPMFKVG